MPTSNPIIPAQPNEARYGIEKLFTSPRLTRPIYKELYGEDAPAYDPKRRIKRWFFTDRVSSNPETNLISVTVYDATTHAVREMSMLESEVSTPNLPGSLVWPKYVNPVPTPALIVDPDGGTKLTMNGAALVDLAQAQAVVDEINAQLGKTLKLVAADPWPWKVVWGAEPRRQMNVTDGTSKWDAAHMLKDRFAKGVGSPGEWEDQGALGPVFVPETPNDGEQDARPEIPMPCRPLLSNERFGTVFPGSTAVIERTDLLQDEQGPGTGGLTAAQDARLTQIAADTAALVKR